MNEQDVEVSLKVIVVGNGCVGKTSLATLFAKGAMTENYKKTIGTDFMEKTIQLKGEHIKLMIWDTAGQEMFATITKNYYKGAGAVVYAFSTTDRESFLEIERWKRKVEDECGSNIVSVLVQNKIDLIDQSQITVQEVEDLARRLGIRLYRTSVKQNILVNDVFEYLAMQYLHRGAPKGAEAVPDIGSFNSSSSSSSLSSTVEKSLGEFKTASNQPSSPVVDLKPVRRTNGKKSGLCYVVNTYLFLTICLIYSLITD